MRVLIATDGHLDPEKATEIVTRLVEPGDAVTLLTAIEPRREFSRDRGETSAAKEVALIAHEPGPGMASGAVTAESVVPIVTESGGGAGLLGDYFTMTARLRVEDLLAHLESRGIEADTTWSPVENHTADTILEQAELLGVDVIVIGSHHGKERFKAVLGSTVKMILRRTSIPVVVIT
jgi:nucleotide-binding universal stress UspA family protein